MKNLRCVFSAIVLMAFGLVTFAQRNFNGYENKCYHLHESEHSEGIESRGVEAITGYDVTHVKMEITAIPLVPNLKGKITTTLITHVDMDTLKYDLSSDVQSKIDSVFINGNKQVGAYVSGDVLHIPLSATVPAGNRVISEVTYEVTPGLGFNTSRYFYSGKNRFREDCVWGMSQPYGSKYWWPANMGLEDKIDSLDVLITHPQAFTGVSSGIRVKSDTNNAMVTTHWKHNYPIATYLVAFAVGNYKRIETPVTVKGKILPVVNYMYPDYAHWTDSLNGHLEKTFVLFDSLFGSYPFEKEHYGHVQTSIFGGMEHQTMSHMVDLNQPLVAHELAHQWFGDKVTCGSWEDLWLNEGFATYLTALTYEKGFGDRDWYDWKSRTLSFITSVSDGSVWPNDTTSFFRLFSGRLTYNKAAYVLHGLRNYVGDKAFFDGLKNYMNDPALDYGFAKTEHLKQHIEATSGQDLTEFINDWYYGEGYPSFDLKWHMQREWINFTIDQKGSTARSPIFNLVLPVAVYGNGKRRDVRIPIANQTERFIHEIGFVPDSVVIDPDLWIIAGEKKVTEELHEGLGIYEKDNRAEELQVYPNPAKSFVQIRRLAGFKSTDQLELLDLNGRLIKREELEDAPGKSIDVSQLNPGMYWIKYTSQQASSVVRFVVE